MITLYLEKLYRYPRKREHMTAAVPFAPGVLTDTGCVRVLDGEEELPVQCRATARYADGSVKYLFVRFMGDLPGNQTKEFALDWTNQPQKRQRECSCAVVPVQDGYQVTTGALRFAVRHHGTQIFEWLDDGNQVWEGARLAGPYLEERRGGEILTACQNRFGAWRAEEEGPLCVILKNRGTHVAHNKVFGFELKLTAWAEKPWLEISCRVVNTSESVLDIGAIGFYCRADADSPFGSEIRGEGHTGMMKNVSGNRDSQIVLERKEQIYRVKGTGNLAELEALCPVSSVRTCTGYSNYKTDFTVGADGACVTETAYSGRLMYESNEHFSEVFYGTFFADRTDHRGGICATVYQAQQNYPKAVSADKNGLSVMLVPRGEDRVSLQPGMSREQRFLLHFHGPKESLAELDNRSLIYQMPDRPVISPQVFRDAGVMPDVFPQKMDPRTERMLIRRADGHNRAFGMLNWGDSMDQNYTSQGRGGGKPVWVNNEYDYPHACALMYARTGTRRFLDYLLVSASHWMDVDICHYSKDPLWMGGQVEHTRKHVEGGKIVPSHEWVEGLLDYYHFTGDRRGLESAVGIGENVLRLLETPMYAKTGEMNARETGWALRTLTALYVETGEERWLGRCQWIVGHFRQWEQDYGHWLSPYTDNTLIRVGFMISVAVGSLMRYERICPSEEVKGMILRAVDDLLENCLLDNGLFYYKELPSLARLGNNTLLLEALTAAYELTGDSSYLEAGRETFEQAASENRGNSFGTRIHVDDAVIWPGDSSKTFAQSFLPLALYDRALEKAGLR